MIYINKLSNNKNYNNQSFEDIKHFDENGIEFWYARDLIPILQYAKWQNFKKIIDKAIITCQNSKISIKDCFTDISKPIISGKRKGLRYREDILDNTGSEELAANLFRIAQTESRLKKDNTQTKKEACISHNKIGKIVRKAIKEAGGTMPEDLPTPNKSLKQLEKENKNSLIK